MRNELRPLARIWDEHDRFLILTHERPDGDAFGASLGLLSFLLDNGKRAELLLPEPVPPAYKLFMPVGNANIKTALSIEELSSYSLCLSVDNANTKRAALGPAGLALDNFPIPLINIDHHPDNQNFGAENFVCPDCAASAEIIYETSRFLSHWRISSHTATLLLLGLVMDTGSFRFDNTSPALLHSAAELLAHGADHHLIVEKMFFSKPVSILRFESELMNRFLRIDCGGRYAYCRLDAELAGRHGVDLRHTEGLIDLLRGLDGVIVAALFLQRPEGVKISLRSKDPKYPVAPIARRFSGGGHELAAGGIIQGASMEEAEQKLLVEIRALLDSD